MQRVFTFEKSFYLCNNKKTNFKKQQKNKVMKKSDFLIIVIGVALFTAVIGVATYLILTNTVAANIGVIM